MKNGTETPYWLNWNKVRLHRLSADLLLAGVFLLTGGLYAMLMIRDRVPHLGLAVLAVLWLVHWVLKGRQVITPLAFPIIGLLAFGVVSLIVTIDRELTLPKVYGIILGAVLFYIIIQYTNSRLRLHLALLVLVALALGMAGLGLVGTDWSSTKVVDLPLVYDALPRLVENVPRSGDGGIQANLVGGALAFLVPFLFSLLLDKGGFSLARVWDWVNGSRALKIAYKVLLIFTLVVVLFTLLLTQSRGSLLGVLVGVLAVAICHERRFLLALPVLLLNGLLVRYFWGAESLMIFFTSMDAREGLTLPIRREFWARGLRLVQDFPITGTGIGTYSALVRVFYPFPSFSLGFSYSPSSMTHAHNQVLVIANDLGLPGLVLYMALLGGFVAMMVRTWPYAGRLVKAVLAGLAGGMLAHQVFGIMDAFMLGSKLAAMFWIYLGLGAALYIHRGHFGDQRQVPKQVSLGRWERLKAWLAVIFQGTVGWVGVSVLAVAFVHTNTVLSLVLAVIGGVALGVLLLLLYEGTFYTKGKSLKI